MAAYSMFPRRHMTVTMRPSLGSSHSFGTIESIQHGGCTRRDNPLHVADIDLAYRTSKDLGNEHTGTFGNIIPIGKLLRILRKV